MMLLGWESIRQKSAKLEGGNFSLGVGNPRFPILCMKHNVLLPTSCGCSVVAAELLSWLFRSSLVHTLAGGTSSFIHFV